MAIGLLSALPIPLSDDFTGALHGRENPEQAERRNGSASPSVDGVGAVVSPSQAEEDRQRAYREHHPNSWEILGLFLTRQAVKLLTDPVALFTVVLAVSTIALWRATNALGDRADKGMRTLERAYIFVGVNPDAWTAKEEIVFITVHLKIENLGKTPGFVRELSAEVRPDGPAPQGPPVYSPEWTIFDMDHTIKAEVGFMNWKDRKTALDQFIVVAYVKYDDIFGASHISRFCARVRASDGHFNMIGPREWNAWD